MKIFATILALVLLTGCTTMATNQYNSALQQCLNQISIVQDASGNLVRQQPNCSGVRAPADASPSGAMVAGGLGVVALITWLIIELADNNNAAQIPPPQNPLGVLQTGGTVTSTFANTYVQPTLIPVP